MKFKMKYAPFTEEIPRGVNIILSSKIIREYGKEYALI